MSQDVFDRPLHVVLPLRVALEWTEPGDLRDFISERIAAGDPGPLHLVDGVATTAAWDRQLARRGQS